MWGGFLTNIRISSKLIGASIISVIGIAILSSKVCGGWSAIIMKDESFVHKLDKILKDTSKNEER